MITLEALRGAVNAACTCGGCGPDDEAKCPACEVWHALHRQAAACPVPACAELKAENERLREVRGIFMKGPEAVEKAVVARIRQALLVDALDRVLPKEP